MDNDMDLESEKCMMLADKLQDVLHGEEMGRAVVVLVRLAVTACVASGQSKEATIGYLRHVVNDLYSQNPEDLKETIQ